MMTIQSPPHDITPTLKVDKLSILADLPDPEGVTEYLHQVLTDDPTKAEFGLSPGGPTKFYKFSFSGFVPISTDPLIWSSKAAFHVQLQPKGEGLPLMRLDLNPLAFRPAGQHHIIETFRDVLLIDLAADLRHAAVSRVDAAIDIPGIRIDDFAWDKPGSFKRHVIAGKAGTETIYLGSRHASHIAIYDKRRQLKIEGPPLVRVERRDLQRRSTMALLDLPCPFAQLLVATAAAPIPPLHRAAFAAAVRSGGLKAAVAPFPLNMGKAVRDALVAAVPAWWRPHDLWTQWPAMVRSAAPFLFTVPPKLGPFMSSTPTSPTPDGPVDYADAL